jgi:hypothetical protein
MDVQNRIIDAHIFYRHAPEEIAALRRAIAPLADHIKGVGGLSSCTPVMECRYFRFTQAAGLRTILLRAAKHARAHLDEYFPAMREDIIAQAEVLEQAVEDYWETFQRLQADSVPTT